MRSNPKRLAYVAVAFAVAAAVLAAWWLKSEHQPKEAIRVAQDFVQKLEAGQYEDAFELTVKQGYVGRTPDQLQKVSNRELCKLDRLDSTFPFQSNGNRLRRLVFGREVEMKEVNVEFVGECLFGVKLRRTSTNEWRVYKFAAHAG